MRNRDACGFATHDRRMNMKKNRTFHRSLTRTSRRGFTLLEIIVVVTIIALLATLIAPRLLNRIGQAKGAVAKAEVNEIAKQVQLFCVDNGLTRPSDDFELSMLTSGANIYLKASDITDPWGHEYIIIVPGERNPDFDVVSFGADGAPGGEGDNADVVNE
jgi:general secretion pathway protein G